MKKQQTSMRDSCFAKLWAHSQPRYVEIFIIISISVSTATKQSRVIELDKHVDRAWWDVDTSTVGMWKCVSHAISLSLLLHRHHTHSIHDFPQQQTECVWREFIDNVCIVVYSGAASRCCYRRHHRRVANVGKTKQRRRGKAHRHLINMQ